VSGPVDLVDVHRRAVANPVSFSGVAAGDVERAVRFILRELLRRQPLPQELEAARFAILFTPEPVAPSSRLANTFRQEPSEVILRGAKKLPEHEPWLAADKPRKKQSLFYSWIKVLVTVTSPEALQAAAVKPFPEAFLCLRERLRVLRIKIVPGIAGMIHHDLGCHL
jgi:hypothetical protein